MSSSSIWDIDQGGGGPSPGGNHNDLSGLQGGTSGQYYHLTQAQSTIATQTANGSRDGVLSSSDWSLFNGKQNALTLGTLGGTINRISVSGGSNAIIGAGVTVDIDTTLLPSPLVGDIGKALIVTGANAAAWTTIPTPVTSHGSLTGLSNDDHLQYLLLLGRNGGQTIAGGTAVTDTLTLKPTTGVGTTGADIIFKVGNNGATEAMRLLNNGYFGVGTPSPTEPFTVLKSGITLIRVGDSATGGSLTLGQHNTLGPIVQAHTDSSGNSLQNAACVRMNFGASGFQVFTSPATIIGNPRTFTNRFVVNQSGNVGINTTTQVAKLAINGGVHVGGDSDPGDNNLSVDGILYTPIVAPSTNGITSLKITKADGVTSLINIDSINSIVNFSTSILKNGYDVNYNYIHNGSMALYNYPVAKTYNTTIINVTDEATLISAIASATAFDVISIDADITLTATLVINKALKFTGSHILQSAGGGTDPVTLINITANDVYIDSSITIKHKKTTNTSVEIAISLSSAERFISQATVEFMEFGYTLRGSFSIGGKTTYTGALANNHRHFAVYNVSNPSEINGVVFDFTSEATPRDSFVYLSSNVASDKFNSVLRIANCVQFDMSKIGRQFYLQDAFVSDVANGLIVENCKFNQLNGDIGVVGASGQNVLTFFGFISLLNNYAGNAATLTDSYKGLFYMDGSGAIHNYGTTNFYYANNYHSTTLRSANDYTSVYDLGGITYKNTAYDNSVPLSVKISTIDNSIYNYISQLCSKATVSGDVSHSLISNRDVAGNHSKLIPLTNSTTAIQITKADGTTPIINVDSTNGNVGLYNITAPSARLHLPAGSASASSSPLKFTSGTLLTAPEVGSFEFLTDNIYFTITTGTTRKSIPLSDKTYLPGYAHATFKSPTGANGIFHCFGYYYASATSKVFSEAATTQTWGTANTAYGAKAFLVASGPGSVSGGTTGTAKITVTGTSITDGGVRTASDSEILIADVTTLTTNQYVETTKYWVGTITYTIATTGDRTTFTVTCNYGFAKYYEFFESKVILDKFEITGRAGANDTGFNVQLLLHDGTGWTYNATAFIPGGTTICALDTDYVTEKNLSNGQRFAYERYSLNRTIDGTSSHIGIVCRITTSVNNAIESSDTRVEFKYV